MRPSSVLVPALFLAVGSVARGDVVSDAKAVFSASCYGCHGRPPHRPVAGLNILATEDLVGRGLIVPGSAAFSLPYQYMEAGQMPPPGENFPDGSAPEPVTPDDLAKVKAWIEAGAPPLATDPGASRRVPPYGDVLTTVRDDLARVPVEMRGNMRYLSLAHLLGAPLSDESLLAVRTGVAKLINSLSLSPTIVPPRLVSATKLVFRIDLRDYKWVAATWRILEVAYPFGSHDRTSSAERALEREIADASGARVPFVRGDWLVAVGARPPLYHEILYRDLLGIPGKRRATALLEEALGIDRIANILAGNVSRSGFSNSGVSVNNRIVERHEIREHQGAYWLSYDFASTSAEPSQRQNIFAAPLGPKEAFPNDGSTYLHAGGEVIFALPNGLHAYLLIDNADNRLDKGPTTIVTDPARPDRAVENAVSCFRCHDHGIKLKPDTMHDFVVANRDLFARDVNVLLSLYPGREANFALQRQDLNAYLKAVIQTGVELRQPEPITATVQAFEADLDARALAAELYISRDDLVARIAASEPLRRILGALTVPEGRVKRDFVIENFAAIASLTFTR